MFLLTLVLLALLPPNLQAEGLPEFEEGTCGIEKASGFTSWLPDTFKPTKYELYVKTELPSESYSGNVTISLEIDPKSSGSLDRIVLHADSALQIDAIQFWTDGQLRQPIKICRNADHQLLVVELPEELNPSSKSRLSVEFTGQLGDSPDGFYLSRANDQSAQLVASLEPEGARTAFPCFDEPRFGALFELSVEHASHLKVVSNANLKESRELDDGRSVSIFEPSASIPTRLLTFVVGELESVETILFRRLALRVWARPALLPLAYRILLLAGETLTRTSRLLKELPFPGDKLDLIALSESGSSGWREGWSTVLFSEAQLEQSVIDDQSLNKEAEQALGLVQSVVQQWLGNQLLLRDWRELWLKEGVATFLSYQLAHQFLPSFNFNLRRVVDSAGSAIDQDQMGPPRAVRGKAEPVFEYGDRAEQFFDSMSYGKGAQVIDMLANLVIKDQQAFLRLLQQFILLHQGSPVGLDEFCVQLDKISSEACGFLRIWLDQPGHPIVRVSRLGSRRFLLEQVRHFTAEDESSEDSPSEEQLWQVPVLVQVGNQMSTKIVETTIRDGTALLKMPGWFGPDWLLVNTGVSGFYCVQYQDELRKQLRHAIKQRSLSALDRLQVIEDAHHLFRSNNMKADQLLELIGFFAEIPEYQGFVIARLADAFQHVMRLESLSPEMVQLGKRLFGNFLRTRWATKLDEPAIDHSSRLGQAAALETLIELDDRWAVDKTLEMFRRLRCCKGRVVCKQIPRHLREPVYLALVNYGTADEFDYMIKLYKQIDRETELKSILSDCLARAKDADRERRVSVEVFGNNEEEEE